MLASTRSTATQGGRLVKTKTAKNKLGKTATAKAAKTTTTSLKTNTSASRPVKRRKYELILHWADSNHVAAKLQKLAFTIPEPTTFAAAYREAVEIRRLLLSVGDFSKADARLIAVNELGALELYQETNHVFTKAKQQELRKLIAQAKQLKKSKIKMPVRRQLRVGIWSNGHAKNA